MLDYADADAAHDADASDSLTPLDFHVVLVSDASYPSATYGPSSILSYLPDDADAVDQTMYYSSDSYASLPYAFSFLLD
jgi:hypothetical protein